MQHPARMPGGAWGITWMSESAAFGQWLRQRRKAYDLTQEDLAERVNCGFETIRKIESGRRRPSRSMAELLGQALGIPAAELPAFVEFARLGSGSPEPAAPASQEAPVAPPLTPPPRRRAPLDLPVFRTTLVGRTREAGEVGDLLARDEVRLVTLLGPPGIGKTRLSMQVAAAMHEQLADGAVFVPLAAVTDPAQAGAAIARRLGAKEVSGQPLSETLKNYLQGKELLLVLDNFEQIIPAAPLVGELIDACPELKVLVSSRTALALYGEQQYPVPPLALPDPQARPALDALTHYEAIDLFVQRARALKPDFRLTADTAPAVAEICRQLDGLPLAIELAAARTKALAPAAILARLSNRLALLTGGPADRTPRQQTLRGAIAWSDDLLDAADKTLFRRMAVFVRGATLDAVEAICRLPGEPPLDALAGVTSLLDKSLLRDTDAPGDERRYSMLWTIREYAEEQLVAHGEADAIRRQHADYYLALVEAAEPHLRSAGRDAWLARLDQEHDNVLAALGWGLAAPERAGLALRMAGALHWFWYFRGYLSEGRDWIERALAAAGAERPTAAGAKALDAAGRLALLQDDYAVMRPRLEESVAVWRAVGDDQGLAYALANLGIATAYRNRDVSAGGHLLIEEAVNRFRATGDQWGLAFALDLMGDVTGLLGGDDLTVALCKEESLATYRELGDQWGIATELSELGQLALRQGDYDTARTQLEEAVALEQVAGDRWFAAHSIRSLGDIAWHQGDLARAQALYNESLALYRELGDTLRASAALRNLGHIARDQGDYGEAAILFRRSLRLVHDLGNEQTVALCLAALAGVAALQGRPERAARLFGAADALREASRGLVPAPDLAASERGQAIARATLGEAAFARAWAEGRALPVAEAVAYAIRPGDDARQPAVPLSSTS
jgi:predicted ATPase/transcriptional regulator with XRE-family HTH domain/Tfp pilus assembly protein PilF